MRTPLHYAVKGNKVDSVQYLLSVGASPLNVDRWGLTPVNYANNNTDIISLIEGYN